MHREMGLGREAAVETAEQRAAAGEHDPTGADVRGELGRSRLKRLHDRVDDRGDRLRYRGSRIVRRDRRAPQEARQPVSAGDLGLEMLRQLPGRAARDLRGLRRFGADEQALDGVEVAHDRLVELVTADADRLPHDHLAQRQDRDLRRSAADVDDHAALRLGDREPGADRGGQRLLDQHDRSRAGGHRRLLDGFALDLGDAARHAEDDAREREPAAADAADEVPQHLRSHFEIGDNAVPQRPDRADRGRRSADHAPSLFPDRVDGVRPLVDRYHRRLEDDDSTAAEEHQRVRGA